MAGMSIERLAIDAPGLTEAEGRALARLVADRLGAAAARIDRPIRQPAVQLVVAGSPSGDVDALASRIVDDLLRHIGATV
jgi:hypothetical protein